MFTPVRRLYHRLLSLLVAAAFLTTQMATAMPSPAPASDDETLRPRTAKMRLVAQKLAKDKHFRESVKSWLGPGAVRAIMNASSGSAARLAEPEEEVYGLDIQPFAEEHIPDLVRIDNLTEPVVPQARWTSDDYESYLSQMKSEPGVKAYVASENERVIGGVFYETLSQEYINEVYTQSVADPGDVIIGFVQVDPDFREKKVGTFLLQTVLGGFRGPWKRKVIALINVANSQGINFLMSLGFAPEGSPRKYIRSYDTEQLKLVYQDDSGARLAEREAAEEQLEMTLQLLRDAYEKQLEWNSSAEHVGNAAVVRLEVLRESTDFVQTVADQIKSIDDDEIPSSPEQWFVFLEGRRASVEFFNRAFNHMKMSRLLYTLKERGWRNIGLTNPDLLLSFADYRLDGHYIERLTWDQISGRIEVLISPDYEEHNDMQSAYNHVLMIDKKLNTIANLGGRFEKYNMFKKEAGAFKITMVAERGPFPFSGYSKAWIEDDGHLFMINEADGMLVSIGRDLTINYKHGATEDHLRKDILTPLWDDTSGFYAHDGARLVTAGDIIGDAPWVKRFDGELFAWPEDADTHTREAGPLPVKEEIPMERIAKEDEVISGLLLDLAESLGLRMKPMENRFSKYELTRHLPEELRVRALRHYESEARTITDLGLGPVVFLENGTALNPDLPKVRHWGLNYQDRVSGDTSYHMPHTFVKDRDMILMKSSVIYARIFFSVDEKDPAAMRYLSLLARRLTGNDIRITHSEVTALQDFDPRGDYRPLALQAFTRLEDIVKLRLYLESLIRSTSAVSA